VALGQEIRLDAPLAIENVAIVPSPGVKIEAGTILIRDGRIIAVGENIETPPGFRRIDGKGLTAYAGFIDGLTRKGAIELKPDEVAERRVEDEFPSYSAGPRAATVEANRAGIYAGLDAEQIADVKADTWSDARKSGFAAALLAGPKTVIGPNAAVVQLSDRPLRRSILATGLGHAASFDSPGRALADRGRYPNATFAVIAHVRQIMNDAMWYRDMAHYAATGRESAAAGRGSVAAGRGSVAAGPRTGRAAARGGLPYDADLQALQPVIAGQLPLLWEADHADEIHRVLNLAAELGFKPIIVGGREAYQVIDRLKQANTPVLVSLKLPDEPREYKFEPDKLRKKADDDSLYGKEWENRPFDPKAEYEWVKSRREEQLRNAAELEKAGVKWAFAAYALTDSDNALASVAELVKAGLDADAALRGLTTSPAALLGMDAQLGTIAKGNLGNLTLLTKPLGDKDAKVRWVVVGGNAHELEVSDSKEGGERGNRRDGAAGRGRRARPDAQTPSDPQEEEEEAEEEDPAQVEESKQEKPESETAEAAQESETKPAAESESKPDDKAKKEPVEPGPYDDILLLEPSWPIESEADRDPGFKTGGDALLTHALVLTISGDDLADTDVLIRGGKISKIGRDLSAPEGVKTVDLTGYVIMPGIIDPHSHIALDSINEGALAVVPEVRCEDVVRHDDGSIFQALAGGTTTIHAMHGSANPIGGQNVILKLKYGKPASDLIVHDRHRTVKFATGENVKRPGMDSSRRFFGGEGDRPPLRFPGSRMGVEVTMRRALAAGREYGEQWAEYQKAKKAGKDVEPMRRDLRLEALSDIIHGDIWVHSHCYRADEILRLLGTAEDFGFRIAVLQHVLEGYRIMPEIARHGCGTSTFADWWAYKIEAYNAVPQNAGMLLRYGVNSTINSDSGDLIRHLNHEAAKCMKYSGLTANEALRLITLNGANQLGLGDRVGSIEVGKDADIAVFDGHPLDTFAKCVMTFVEGECYFRHRDFDPEATRPPTHEARSFARGPGGPAAGNGAHTLLGTSGNGAAGMNAAGVYAIVGGTIHPVSAEPLENGTLLIRDGRIEAVGRDLPIPSGATVIDARGRHVWPGLINAGSQVGMDEIGQVDVTIDTGETGTYQPDVLAISGFNPHSAMVPVTAADGVLTALVFPSSPTIAGQAGLVNLDGWTTPEMLVEPRTALVVNLPSRRAKPIVEGARGGRFGRGRRGGDAGDQDDNGPSEALKNIERFFRDARLYADAMDAAHRKGGEPTVAVDPRFDAMVPYVRGEKPVLFRADGYKEILEVLMFAGRLELKPVIFGGRDAWRLADLLAKREVPVIFEGVFSAPRDPDQWDCYYRALDTMSRAGVKFCLAHSSSSLAKNLAVEAGFAVAHGLDPDAALRAMTLTSAEILGVADRLGSLESGKAANVIVTTDHPCQVSSVVTEAFVGGRPISLDNQHKRFAEQFADRPEPALPPAPSQAAGPPSQTASYARTAAAPANGQPAARGNDAAAGRDAASRHGSKR
jgi:imidazolonepropionase-like amidohydrolase